MSEYWRFDATGGDFCGEQLVGERLVDGEYRRFDLRQESDGRTWSHSHALNLDLWWDDGQLRSWFPVAVGGLLSHEEDRTGRLEVVEAGSGRGSRSSAKGDDAAPVPRKPSAGPHLLSDSASTPYHNILACILGGL